MTTTNELISSWKDEVFLMIKFDRAHCDAQLPNYYNRQAIYAPITEFLNTNPCFETLEVLMAEAHYVVEDAQRWLGGT